MKRYLRITLSGSYRESAPLASRLAPAAGGRRFRLDQLIVVIEKALRNPRVSRVLIECRSDFAPGLIAGAEEIRRQISRLTEAGRQTFFYAPEYNGLTLYLASACSRRVIHPLGTLSYLGLARPFLFFRGLLDRQKIEPLVFRRGEYKSAADRLHREELSSANREQYEAYLASVTAQMEERIREGYGKGESDLRDLRNGTMLTAEAAVEEGWVHELSTIGELTRRWEEELKRWRPGKLKREYGRGRRKIAVLFLEGAIIDGESRNHPIFGESRGDRTVVAEIRRLADDKSVRGVIFRVNSPGGSATASEEILASLRRLAEKKPLVVSMAGVAGSGGYWVSLAGERLFAEGTTLTGSIGVITVSLYLQKFLKRLGITSETIRTGEHADLGSGLRQMTKKERQLIQAVVDELYHRFVTTVADARGREAEEIDAVARGRVWSGKEAVEKRLVDEIGGLQDAIDYLVAALRLKRYKVRYYPEEKKSLLTRLLLKGSPLSFVGELPATTLASVVEASRPLLFTPEALEREALLEKLRAFRLIP
ncbi:MAG: signal peptide peptidase SppA [Alkalispirochaetaceae bacterium]